MPVVRQVLSASRAATRHHLVSKDHRCLPSSRRSLLIWALRVSPARQARPAASQAADPQALLVGQANLRRPRARPLADLPAQKRLQVLPQAPGLEAHQAVGPQAAAVVQVQGQQQILNLLAVRYHHRPHQCTPHKVSRRPRQGTVDLPQVGGKTVKVPLRAHLASKL